MVIRKRLIFWLIKAYVKKSGKIIFLSFLLGLVTFFAIIFASKYFSKLLPVVRKESVGIVGAYRQDNLPDVIANKFSRGLTKVESNGSIKPDLAQKWEIKDGGKTYIFYLKQNEYFGNGKNVTSEKIVYNFSDVATQRPEKYKIIFKLKDPYAPFLVTVSKGIFEKGLVGVGSYKIQDIKLNGNFIQSLTMASVKNRFDTIRFQFYPSEDALKLAFLLGEVSKITGLTNPSYADTSFAENKNVMVNKVANYNRLVTLFYNTKDSLLSDNKTRIGLSYALPNNYQGGRKTYLPYSPESIYYNHNITPRNQDYEHAKLLIESANESIINGSSTLNIKTLKQYKKTAEEIANSWENIGIKTNIVEVDGLPDSFQIFLGDFTLPKDPDQYSLWHSGQENNITKYKNLRIDKFLEDGRKEVDSRKRKEIYIDFQKFLMEDMPASFLYFPYEYEIIRK